MDGRQGEAMEIDLFAQTKQLFEGRLPPDDMEAYAAASALIEYRHLLVLR